VAAALTGATVRLAGRVGDDANGTVVRASLETAGVDVSLLRTVIGRSTGVAVVMVTPDGENAIAVSPGANHALSADDVDALSDHVRDASVLLLQMELPVDVATRAAVLAKASGTTVVLNLAPAVQVPVALLSAVDVLVVNESEAASLLEWIPEDNAGLLRAARDLLARGPAAVVVTAGGAGAVVGSGDGVVHVPAIPVDVVDTTGAGDAFVGVLASCLDAGISLRESVATATRAGAAAVQTRGAQLVSLDTSTGGH
jgi:ribokinase